jgi:hypothetical protein
MSSGKLVLSAPVFLSIFRRSWLKVPGITGCGFALLNWLAELKVGEVGLVGAGAGVLFVCVCVSGEVAVLGAVELSVVGLAGVGVVSLVAAGVGVEVSGVTVLSVAGG